MLHEAVKRMINPRGIMSLCLFAELKTKGPSVLLRPLFPFMPRAGVNGARKHGLTHGPQDDEL